jgi:hypothetical protein
MLELSNKNIRLTMKADGSELVVTDLMRGCSWELDGFR